MKNADYKQISDAEFRDGLNDKHKQKILFCLQHTLGDVILGTPVIEALRKKYPNADITWALYPEYAEIADTNPNIKGLILTREIDVLLQEIANPRYDMVLIPAQISLTDTSWHHREKYKHGHLVDFYAMRCGVEITERETIMFPSDKDRDRVWELEKAESRIAIHTMSRVPSKDWNKFGELVEALRKRYPDKELAQIGGPEDTWSGADIDLRGKLTYNQLAAYLGSADLFIGVDSGLAYIADSVKCPSIVIMGMSTQGTSGPISGRPTFMEPKRPKGCEYACHTNCKHGKPCIQSITLEEVMSNVEAKICDGRDKDGGRPGRDESAGAEEGTEAEISRANGSD